MEGSNVGMVFVKSGGISKVELAKELSDTYKTNWPWPINSLDEWTYLVKFTPKILMEQVASYPCLGMMKDNVKVWKGGIDSEVSLREVWIKLRKMNHKWCGWYMIDQVTSAFGVL